MLRSTAQDKTSKKQKQKANEHEKNPRKKTKDKHELREVSPVGV